MLSKPDRERAHNSNSPRKNSGYLLHEEAKGDETMNQASPAVDRENPLNKSTNDVFKRLARDRKKTVSVNATNDLKPTRQTSQNHMLVRNNSNFSRENSASSRGSEIQRVTE